MPNTFTAGRILSAFELTRMAAAIAGTYVFPSTAGGAVTTNGNMAPSVAAVTAGLVIVNGATDATGQAGTTVTISAADVTNPRRDYIYYEPGVGFGVTAGVPAANPNLPPLTAGRIAIYEVYVAANDTSIDAGDLIDRRANVAVVNPFDGIRTQFRAARRLLAECSFTTVSDGTVQVPGGIGVGIRQTASTAQVTISSVLLEAVATWLPGAAATVIVGSANSTAFYTATAPNKNPRMLIRYYPGASAANLTHAHAGFFSAIPTATISGAYLRVSGTGNLFFVVSQGGVESKTDLGARPTTPTSYEIYTEDAGVTWVCRNATTGAIVSSLTSNVPTATVALGYGFSGIVADNREFANVSYMRVESASVA